MGKKLVIAEKPSVAADIARALGGFARKGDYFESDEYVLSSAVGHLLELVVPDKYDVKKGKWSFARLPVIPPHFELSPIDRSKERLNLLLRLMKRKDVSGLVNACDAGREGELIFRYLVQHAKAAKPIERLWLQSMTQQAIRDGFSKLRPDKEMLPLADAAKSRSEADWLVGINGTRAMTAFNSKEGGFYLTTVGRVQTPTLAILVEREDKIRAFTSRDYWEVHARFGAKAGEYTGRWFDPEFKKDDDLERKPERLWSVDAAAAIVAALPRQERRSARGDQALDAALAAAVRSDQPAARSERSLRLSRAHDLVVGPGPVREAQGADLSAYRFSCAARGLRIHGEGHPEGAGRHRGVFDLREADSEAGLGQAEQAHLRQHEDLGSLRHHPDAADAQAAERGRAEALRHGGAPLSRRVLPGCRVPADDAHHAHRAASVQDGGPRSAKSWLACGLRPRRRRRRAESAADRARTRKCRCSR